MIPDPRLTSIQSDLVALLHEIGGVIEEEKVLRMGWSSPGGCWNVWLTMTGDNLRRVRVLIGPFGVVVWEVIGQ